MTLLQLKGEQSSDTGIYLTIKCTRYNKVYTVLLTSKKVCLTNKPIILFEDFESISPLNGSNNEVYFDVKLSTKALGILEQLNENFPNAELALVVEKQVFIVFKVNDELVNQIFRFTAQQNETVEFISMHHRLMKMKGEKK